MAAVLHLETRPGDRKGTIFFIHGNSSSLKVFDPIFESDLPYRLVRIDLPGHGKSFRSDKPEDYSVSSYRKALLAVLGEEERVLIVGNSLGGHLAMEIAPDVRGLAGLVIFGSPPVKKPLNIEEAFNPVPEIVNMMTEGVPEEIVRDMFSKVCYNQTVVSVLAKDFFRADPKVRSTFGADISSGRFLDQAKIFSELPVPRFVFHGDLDLTPNLDYIKSLNSPENPFKVIELENCGHYPALDQPEVFTRHLQRICEEVF